MDIELIIGRVECGEGYIYIAVVYKTVFFFALELSNSLEYRLPVTFREIVFTT